MIIQQTLTSREKIFGMFAVVFLVGLVMFGYSTTVIKPAQASVLHSEKIEDSYTERFNQLTEDFDTVREKLNLVKSTAVKSKIRSIKECLIDAHQPTGKQLTALEAYATCEKLFIETETEIDTFQENVGGLENSVNTLEQNVRDYEGVVEQALDELKKKNDATLGKVGH